LESTEILDAFPWNETVELSRATDSSEDVRRYGLAWGEDQLSPPPFSSPTTTATRATSGAADATSLETTSTSRDNRRGKRKIGRINNITTQEEIAPGVVVDVATPRRLGNGGPSSGVLSPSAPGDRNTSSSLHPSMYTGIDSNGSGGGGEDQEDESCQVVASFHFAFDYDKDTYHGYFVVNGRMEGDPYRLDKVLRVPVGDYLCFESDTSTVRMWKITPDLITVSLTIPGGGNLFPYKQMYHIHLPPPPSQSLSLQRE
jgi:hypothetical protein